MSEEQNGNESGEQINEQTMEEINQEIAKVDSAVAEKIKEEAKKEILKEIESKLNPATTQTSTETVVPKSDEIVSALKKELETIREELKTVAKPKTDTEGNPLPSEDEGEASESAEETPKRKGVVVPSDNPVRPQPTNLDPSRVQVDERKSFEAFERKFRGDL